MFRGLMFRRLNVPGINVPQIECFGTPHPLTPPKEGSKLMALCLFNVRNIDPRRIEFAEHHPAEPFICGTITRGTLIHGISTRTTCNPRNIDPRIIIPHPRNMSSAAH